MQKSKISLHECKEGIRLAEDVFNKYGAMISKANTTIDENTLVRLRLNNVNSIMVYDNVIDKTQTNFNEIHKENVFKMKKLMAQIANGEKVKKEPFSTLCENIIQFSTQAGSIGSWLNQIKTVDNYTYSHCVNVGTLSFIIGKWLDLGEEDLQYLTYSGLLHDIGKALISEEILNKPERLDENEFKEIKKHPVLGYRLLQDSQCFPKSVCEGVLMHHERENGSGYPLGISGKKINLFSRIIAIADVYDAMTSDRVYHEKDSPFKVFELMMGDIFGTLDPEIALIFLKNMASYYIGNNVILSDGNTAQIIFINQNDIPHPIVSLTDDNTVINLSQNRNLQIISIV